MLLLGIRILKRRWKGEWMRTNRLAHRLGVHYGRLQWVGRESGYGIGRIYRSREPWQGLPTWDLYETISHIPNWNLHGIREMEGTVKSWGLSRFLELVSMDKMRRWTLPGLPNATRDRSLWPLVTVQTHSSRSVPVSDQTISFFP